MSTTLFKQFSPMRPHPKLSDWIADIGGYEWRPLEGEQPRAVHRWIQSVVLGIRWRKI